VIQTDDDAVTVMSVRYISDHSGRYDAEYERQMQHMKATLHSQAVSFIFSTHCRFGLIFSVFLFLFHAFTYYIQCVFIFNVKYQLT